MKGVARQACSCQLLACCVLIVGGAPGIQATRFWSSVDGHRSYKSYLSYEFHRTNGTNRTNRKGIQTPRFWSSIDGHRSYKSYLSYEFLTKPGWALPTGTRSLMLRTHEGVVATRGGSP